MSTDLTKFGNAARPLSRSPLGIIALFIVLVYGLASMVLVIGKNLESPERNPLIWFLVCFPVLVLIAFVWLVSRHATHLYPPQDFSNEQNFVRLMEGEISEWRSIHMYNDLDRLYLELLKVGLAYPQFINPEATRTFMQSFQDDELLKYETYAFMTWNLCETIYDQRENEALYRTWLPIVKVENRRHRAWFEIEENRLGFKREFQQFVLQSPDLHLNGAD